MKRLFLLLAVLFWAGACSDHPVESERPDVTDYVSFDITEGAVARGTPIAIGSDVTSMGVYCAMTTSSSYDPVTAVPNFMYNVKVSKSGGVWGYSPMKYWSIDPADKYSFFAYSPLGTGTGGNGILPLSGQMTTGIPTIRYTVPVTVENQPDLLIAVPLFNKTKADGAVRFSYKHALTCIAFKAEGSGQTITAIKVSGVAVTGYLSLDGSGAITWSNLGAPVTTEYAVKLNNPTGVTTGSTPTDILATDGYLMMIPQTLSAGAKITITVDGTDHDFPLAGKAWLPGQYLTYTITTTDPNIIDYRRKSVSNCYILNPGKTYKIPIRRVNDFWRDGDVSYFDPVTSAARVTNTIDTIGSDPWNVELLWQDVADMVVSVGDGVTITRKNGSNAGLEEGYFTIEVPNYISTGSYGNFVVGIAKGSSRPSLPVGDGPSNLLWSWHFWVTDYNPYPTAEMEEIEEGRKMYFLPGFAMNGMMHKYSDGAGGNGRVGIQNPWNEMAGIYKDKCMMDRNVGAYDIGYPEHVGNVCEGVLYYQFGRKDPFPTNTTLYGYSGNSLTYSTSANAVQGPKSMAWSVQHPLTFVKQINQGEDWCTINQDSAYIWNDYNVKTNDPVNIQEKSIFDPSPQGFKLPLNGTWSGFSSTQNAYLGSPIFRSMASSGGTNPPYWTGVALWSAGGNGVLLYSNKNDLDVHQDHLIAYPAVGARSFDNGMLIDVGECGGCWSGSSCVVYNVATPVKQGYMFYFVQSMVYPSHDDQFYRGRALPVRSIQE